MSAPARRPAIATQDEAPGLASRRVAARLLAAVVEARTSLDGLTDAGGGHPEYRRLDARDRGLVKAILMAALRRRGTVEAILAACLDRPLPGKAASLRTLLHIGAAQILFLDVPDSAAVDTSVELARADPRNARFTGLVNAILRRVSREKEAFLARFDDPALDCPPWLFERLVAAYGEPRARAIALAHRRPAPLDLSVKADAAGWAERLGGEALATGTVRLPPLDRAVTELAGFAEGAWWVQDAAAALPARLLGEVSGSTVADLCAAPGGKTAQLAAAGARVSAFDISKSRMKRLQENFARLGLSAETHIGDLRALAAREPFDAVLLDAPCSSTGTIRRHPDVAYTKDAAEIGKLAGVQAALLAAAAGLVRPGGRLVFSNCSLDPVEGEAVVEAFLAARPDYARLPVRPAELPGLEEAVTSAGEVRTTPDMLDRGTPSRSGLDGFFAARLARLG
ncbi:RsmB/NOP family class I SAM-dependent RNA methyltransferase [Aureimonas populi]|uniref:RsmB/NOP family class I SAM-dependent RNA methyltransferase n=1 Tax=Aureimonas populi TaxID=1701758 RepID=A0ABW5CS70_9HYPH|nr:transcription antitermination factor NusB [Aureimonas populi]